MKEGFFMRNYQDESTLEWVVDLFESSDNVERIEKHYEDYQITFGDQKKYIVDELRARYPESYDLMPVICLSIAKKIVRKLSRCYAAGAMRTVVDKDTGEEQKELSTLVNYIYNDIDEHNRDFNMIMGRLNEYYSNHRYAELFTYVDEMTNRIRFKPLPQHLFMAVPNKTKTRAEAICFKQDRTDFTEVEKHIDWQAFDEGWRDGDVDAIYTLWTPKDNFDFVRLKRTLPEDHETRPNEVVYKVAVVQNEGNKKNENPYGWNFAQVKDATDGHFYPHGSEIAGVAKEMNIIFSDIVSIAKNQGYAQAVIYYDGETPPAVTKSGPTHVINIPNKLGNSKFEFANPNPDLQGHLEIALSIVRLLLSTNDLTTDKVSGELQATNFASAIDRLIADSETIENIEDQRKKYVALEKRQFEILVKVLQYLQQANLWPEDYPKVKPALLDSTKYQIKVIFGTIKPLTTEKDKASTIDFLFEKGLIKSFERHMRFNEGMTKEEALEREEEIREEQKERAKEFMMEQVGKLKEDLKDANRENANNKKVFPNRNSKEGQKNSRNNGAFNNRRQEAFRERDSKANSFQNKSRERGNFQRSPIQSK
jgi:hypothetical protein